MSLRLARVETLDSIELFNVRDPKGLLWIGFLPKEFLRFWGFISEDGNSYFTMYKPQRFTDSIYFNIHMSRNNNGSF